MGSREQIEKTFEVKLSADTYWSWRSYINPQGKLMYSAYNANEGTKSLLFDLDIPKDATIVEIKNYSNTTWTSRSGLEVSKSWSNVENVYCSAANIKAALETGKRTLKFETGFAGLPSGTYSEKPSYNEAYRQWTIKFTVVYLDPAKASIVHYGAAEGYKDCNAYYGKDGKWQLCDVFYGDAGAYKEIE